MSKNVGIVRRLDNLGRVTIPMEMRKSLGIENRGEVEISAQKNAIMIKKHEPDRLKSGTDNNTNCQIHDISTQGKFFKFL